MDIYALFLISSLPSLFFRCSLYYLYPLSLFILYLYMSYLVSLYPLSFILSLQFSILIGTMLSKQLKSFILLVSPLLWKGLPLISAQLPVCEHPEETYLIVRVHRSTTPIVHCTDFWDDPDTYVDVVVKGNRSNKEELELEDKSTSQRSEKIERKQRTNRVENHIKPRWDSTLDFGCVPRDSELSFSIVDYDTLSESDACLGPLKVSSTEWPKVNELTELCNNDNDCLEYSLLYTDKKEDEEEKIPPEEEPTDKKEEEKIPEETPTEKLPTNEDEDENSSSPNPQNERRGDIEPTENTTPNNETPPENLGNETNDSQKGGDIGIAMAAVGGVLIVAAIFAVMIYKRRQKEKKTDRMLSDLGAPNDEDGADPEDVTL